VNVKFIVWTTGWVSNISSTYFNFHF